MKIRLDNKDWRRRKKWCAEYYRKQATVTEKNANCTKLPNTVDQKIKYWTYRHFRLEEHQKRRERCMEEKIRLEFEKSYWRKQKIRLEKKKDSRLRSSSLPSLGFGVSRYSVFEWRPGGLRPRMLRTAWQRFRTILMALAALTLLAILSSQVKGGMIQLKGQCHEIFCFRFFSRIIFPQAPENNIRFITNFFKHSRRYSQVKVRHWYKLHLWQSCLRCQLHRWQICHWYQRHRRQILPLVLLVFFILMANNGNNIRLLTP